MSVRGSGANGDSTVLRGNLRRRHDYKTTKRRRLPLDGAALDV